MFPDYFQCISFILGRFAEDGSFIGQYGKISKQPSFPPTSLPSSSIVTAKDPVTAAALNPGTFV
jgi:CRP-like cAMP-binding protein